LAWPDWSLAGAAAESQDITLPFQGVATQRGWRALFICLVPRHTGPVKTLLTFVAFGVLAWALWRLLNRQEAGDPGFERRMKADERRARASRQARARASLGVPPPNASTEAPPSDPS
jgi:hypothetical protein